MKRRNALADYTGQGGYAQCSWLLIENTYDYDAAPACPSRPIGRALELCGRFNIVDMNDRTAEVLGGAQKDLSLGLNYYINKHIGIKVNYSYVIPGKTHSEDKRTRILVYCRQDSSLYYNASFLKDYIMRPIIILKMKGYEK